MTPRKRGIGERWRSLYLWHRYIGLAAALMAAWLAVTGLALNHAEDLALASRYVRQDWLLEWYGIRPSTEVHGWNVNGHWFAQDGERVYLDGNFIGYGELVGAAATTFGFAVAFTDKLQLHSIDGALIETVTSPFGKPITAIASDAQGIVLVSHDEQRRADAAFLAFTPISSPAPVHAPGKQALPPALVHRIARDAVQHTLTWERVLLDAHAGRIFGVTGKWLADIAALLLLLLAITGVIVWIQRARRRHS
jgi:hypothetical protein